MPELDKDFFNRADAHIRTANDQLTNECQPGMVTDSLMYGSARFNAWVSAFSSETVDDMKKNRDATITFIMQEYRKMLDANFDDYIENFQSYTQRPDK